MIQNVLYASMNIIIAWLVHVFGGPSVLGGTIRQVASALDQKNGYKLGYCAKIKLHLSRVLINFKLAAKRWEMSLST